jgi:hypothetical protein
MSAVTAQKPCIMKREHYRHTTGQARNYPWIEVTAVKIMTMHNIGPMRRQIKDLLGAGKFEVFQSKARL